MVRIGDDPAIGSAHEILSSRVAPSTSTRIRHPHFQALVTDAATAVASIGDGDTVAISGFASAGTPKAFAPALAERIREVRAGGGRLSVNLLTGASVASEAESLLAEVDGVALRMPYQSEPTARRKINDGRMDYVDIHLSHVAQQVWEGYYGDVDVAVVEVAAITDDGKLVPSMSVGNNKTWLEVADKVILEVNSWVPLGVEGMHDVYYGTALPPQRRPIMLTRPEDRIGQQYLEVDPSKVIAVVPRPAGLGEFTDRPDEEQGHRAARWSSSATRSRATRGEAAAAAGRDRQRGQRGARRPEEARFGPDLLLGGHPGLDAAPHP